MGEKPQGDTEVLCTLVPDPRSDQRRPSIMRPICTARMNRALRCDESPFTFPRPPVRAAATPAPSTCLNALVSPDSLSRAAPTLGTRAFVANDDRMVGLTTQRSQLV
jgi:hypothetical protein